MSTVEKFTEDYQSFLPWMFIANVAMLCTLSCILISYFAGPTLLRLYRAKQGASKPSRCVRFLSLHNHRAHRRE